MLQYRQGEISIPVYLADSVLTPSIASEGQGAQTSFLKNDDDHSFRQPGYTFSTVVGRFTVPRSFVGARQIDRLASLLEECVELELTIEQFRSRLFKTLHLEDVEEYEVEIALELYNQLLELEKQEIDGIWARIIKNAFAPLFAGQFDFITGNPPWVNWANLPEDYRQETASLWQKYNLFTHSGLRARLGGAMDDIAVLMLYASADNFLSDHGKLGFVITQSLFKTEGGGKGFRQFRLGDKGLPLQVIQVDDMIQLQPFDGATNRTSVLFLEKGRETEYPVKYNVWRKRTKRTSIPQDASLDEAIELTRQLDWAGIPLHDSDRTSPWLTGRKTAIEHIRKAIGHSEYQARLGVHCWAVGIYWLKIIAERPDGLIVVSNITESSKKDVETVQTAIEPDLLFPLIRGRDIDKWRISSNGYFLIPQDPTRPDKGYDPEQLIVDYPKTFAYLKHFEKMLASRSGYKKFLEPQNEPFYALYDIGPYTFQPHKVVWMRLSDRMKAAVDSTGAMPDNGGVTFVGFSDLTEAHYFCSVLNSSLFGFAVSSFSVAGTGTWGSPHILRHVKVPTYDTQNSLHNELATLSEEAHQATNDGNPVDDIEYRIDRLAAQLWNIDEAALNEIHQCLLELR